MSATNLLCCLTGSGSSARRTETRGASESSRQALRTANNVKDIIVHPLYLKTLEFPPLEFCPMDWLPDEVITNVLVFLVRLATNATTRTRSS